MKSKIILWGPLHGQNTHSYIYWALERAFEKLGQEVHWFSDQSHPSSADFDYSNSVFIVDNQGLTDRNCPVRDDCIYFSYDEFKDNKYLGRVKSLINFRVAEYKQVFKDDERYFEIEKGVMFDTQSPEPYDVIHLAWATNILPEEIDIDDVNNERYNEYNFVGTVHCPRPNAPPLHQDFIEIVKNNGIEFNHYDPQKGKTEENENIRLMQRSIFVPDFRPQEQKDNWYVPCRVMKAISYGCLTVSDAPYLQDFIDGSLLVSEDAQEIFDLGMANKDNKELILHQMEVVKRDHTYINRCKGLLKIIEKINEGAR